MKKIDLILRILLSLILVMPIFGTLGIFPKPTADMYTTKKAFDFITLLMDSGYVMWMMSVVFIICLYFIFKNKMAPVALLLLPITLNIIGFHAFLDGGLLNPGAIMAIVFFALNIYFLWKNREVYKLLT